MKTKIGIRREDINKWEKRVPLIPSHARELINGHPLEIQIQPSTIRIFTDADYRISGIPVRDDLSACDIVLALKEIPIERLEKDKTYVFFSHTAKGQSHNMPMLKKMMDMGCSIIDYEKMVNDKGQRVLFFGNYAGHAGMIDTLWALGRRLAVEGIPNPFEALHPTHYYKNLVDAKEAVGRVAWKIIREGLPRELDPLVIGFFGYGHTSQGAQEILDILPVEAVQPRDLPRLFKGRPDSPRTVYKVVFKEEDMVERTVPGRPFDLQDYYQNPQEYRPVVESLVPCLTAIVNGIYWAPKYPKFVTKPFLKKLFGGGRPRLRVIGDITCDIDGSIESTVEATDPENPVYVYDPFLDKPVFGFEGTGPVVLAVYNLPAELPLEASTYFSGGLKEHVPALAKANFRATFEDCGLPDVIRRAVILYRGKLTPDYAYLGPFVQ
ncbi:MAG: bifunctional lysine ketoglutarate reductase /saccharopine dehydrogenase family protein [Candidatus Aminicenantales bacterium]